MNSVFDDPEKQEQDLETQKEIKRFTEAIKEQRLSKNISQMSIAKKEGLNQKVISEVESGGNFKMSTYIKMCRGIGLVPRITFRKYRPNKPSQESQHTFSS
jgi:transcriptional regulator with XRE-family HTH domain